MRDAPHLLGPYRLIAPVGRGANGQVWRAAHDGAPSGLAIKIVTHARSAAATRAFERELCAVAGMNHPRVVRLHDHGRLPDPLADALSVPPGAPYIVMDLARHGTLRTRLGALDWPALRATLLGLLDGLAHAHARGVVHRDLKPANVLLDAEGPVLSDFGIALLIEGGDAHDDGSRGTPNYMAPEQVRREARQIGPATDLYALGCLAHALAEGRAPFAGRGSVGAMKAHLEETAPPISDRWPPAFAAWVAGLLAKAPEDRPRFAAEAAAALAAIDGAPPALSWRRPRPSPPPRLAGVHRAMGALRDADPIGRGDEQAALWRSLEAAIGGPRVEVVVLSGATGSGASHLARWLARRAHELGRAAHLWATHEPAPGVDDGLGPMLARHLRLDGLTGVAAIRQAARALEVDRDDPLTRLAAAASAPDGRVGPDGAAAALTLPNRRERLAALADVLARLCARGPRVLVIDDAQWSPDALPFVEHLLTRRPALPLLVVLTVATDRLDAADAAALDALARHAQAAALRLEPLADPTIAELIRARVSAAPSLIRALVERSAGSPGLADGWLRLCDARGLLAQDVDGMRLVGPLPPLGDRAGPWLERVAAALDPLPDPRPAWAALELCAVFGRHLTDAEAEGLCAAAGLPPPDAARAALTDAGLIVDEAHGWRFAQAMVREALEARAGPRAARWHRACAAWLDRTGGADPARLALHREAAGESARAVAAYLSAATEARTRTDLIATRRALMGAARALRRARVRRGAAPWPEILARWALVDVSAGRSERARRRAERADRLAEGPADRAWAAYALGEATLGSHPAAAEIHLARAGRHAAVAGLLDLEVRCVEARGWSLYGRGQIERIDRALDRIRIALAALDDPVREANVLFLRAVAARARGATVRAAGHLAEAEALYRRAGLRHGLASVRNELGELALAEGRPEEAEHHYLALRRLSEELAHRTVMIADLNLGRVYDALGRPADAERHRRAALRVARHRRDTELVAFAEVCLLADAARARQFADWPRRFEAMASLRDGTLVALEAAEAACRAGELAAEAGAWREAASAWDLAAVQYDRLGRAEDAARMRRRARTLVEAMTESP